MDEPHVPLSVIAAILNAGRAHQSDDPPRAAVVTRSGRERIYCRAAAHLDPIRFSMKALYCLCFSPSPTVSRAIVLIGSAPQ